MGEKVLVGMSGGVDSSAAAFLLKERGYEVAGATFILWDKDVQSDMEDARAVCAALGIPHYAFDLRREFRENVVNKFAESYATGTTPNPCIFCNKTIKFGIFAEKADELGFDYIATGHYASVIYSGERNEYRIKKSDYTRKDQSYVLYCVERNLLSRILTPLGAYEKSEIRIIAAKSGLPIHAKAESQDICFIPDGNYAGFLREYTGNMPPEGDFLDLQGNVLGIHRGITEYTIGQRKGLGISFGTPMFVCGIDASKNTVTLADDSELWKNELSANRVNWLINPPPIGQPTRFHAKIRYSHIEQPATVTCMPDNTVSVVFDAPQRAITPGQSVVFYNGAYLAGGGVIL